MTKSDAEITKDINDWLKLEDKKNGHIRTALENASRIFDDKDNFTVNTLEGIYGKETSFGTDNLGTRGGAGAEGHFQMERVTAEKYSKTKITAKNDPRFDIDNSSQFASMYLVNLNRIFGKVSILLAGVSTIPIPNMNDRRIFVIAAYNGGEGRIARAQMAAQKDGKDPTKWSDVKNYLKEAGATNAKIKEILDYVELVQKYEKEFIAKSKANKKLKDKEAKKISEVEDGHWITLDNGQHIFIENKKGGGKKKKT